MIVLMLTLSGFTTSCRRAGVVDRLQDPWQVTAVDPDSLVLSNGSRIEVPGVGQVFTQRGLLKGGVEIAENGNPYVLIEVFHECGNDPIEYQLERVPLRELVETVLLRHPNVPVPKEGGVFAGRAIDPVTFYELTRRCGVFWDGTRNVSF